MSFGDGPVTAGTVGLNAIPPSQPNVTTLWEMSA
jgi:hypothetical protein